MTTGTVSRSRSDSMLVVILGLQVVAFLVMLVAGAVFAGRTLERIADTNESIKVVAEKVQEISKASSRLEDASRVNAGAVAQSSAQLDQVQELGETLLEYWRIDCRNQQRQGGESDGPDRTRTRTGERGDFGDSATASSSPSSSTREEASLLSEWRKGVARRAMGGD